MGEKQYEDFKTRFETEQTDRFGLMVSHSFEEDPKRVGFTFARYGFVAQMFSGFSSVLEVGCGDGQISRVVRQTVGALTAVDFDDQFVADAQEKMNPKWPISYGQHDILSGPVTGGFDGAYSLDVLEHIDKSNEGLFVGNIAKSLTDDGSLIIGMPSLESQAYASPVSKAGHINCKTQDDLTSFLKGYFHNVFPFGMNDSTLHTGYGAMCHYLLALCVRPKR